MTIEFITDLSVDYKSIKSQFLQARVPPLPPLPTGMNALEMANAVMGYSNPTADMMSYQSFLDSTFEVPTNPWSSLDNGIGK